jgi:hypothetical protein
MNDSEIDTLKLLLAQCKFTVLWHDDNPAVNALREVIKIGEHPDEPGQVGYFANGEYIALYVVDIRDLRLVADYTKLLPSLLGDESFYGET